MNTPNTTLFGEVHAGTESKTVADVFRACHVMPFREKSILPFHSEAQAPARRAYKRFASANPIVLGISGQFPNRTLVARRERTHLSADSRFGPVQNLPKEHGEAFAGRKSCSVIPKHRPGDDSP